MVSFLCSFVSQQSVVLFPDINSHEEMGLVTTDRFLGCAESAVLIFEQILNTCLHDVGPISLAYYVHARD